jgi:hypothetical protein
VACLVAVRKYDYMVLRGCLSTNASDVARLRTPSMKKLSDVVSQRATDLSLTKKNKASIFKQATSALVALESAEESVRVKVSFLNGTDVRLTGNVSSTACASTMRFAEAGWTYRSKVSRSHDVLFFLTQRKKRAGRRVSRGACTGDLAPAFRGQNHRDSAGHDETKDGIDPRICGVRGAAERSVVGPCIASVPRAVFGRDRGRVLCSQASFVQRAHAHRELPVSNRRTGRRRERVLLDLGIFLCASGTILRTSRTPRFVRFVKGLLVVIFLLS